MGAPHSDIIGQDKQSLSPKVAAPEKVAPKNSDPPTMATASWENPSDLREALKDAEDNSYGERKEFQCTKGVLQFFLLGGLVSLLEKPQERERKSSYSKRKNNRPAVICF